MTDKESGYFPTWRDYPVQWTEFEGLLRWHADPAVDSGPVYSVEGCITIRDLRDGDLYVYMSELGSSHGALCAAYALSKILAATGEKTPYLVHKFPRDRDSLRGTPSMASIRNYARHVSALVITVGILDGSPCLETLCRIFSPLSQGRFYMFSSQERFEQWRIDRDAEHPQPTPKPKRESHFLSRSLLAALDAAGLQFQGQNRNASSGTELILSLETSCTEDPQPVAKADTALPGQVGNSPKAPSLLSYLTPIPE